MKKMTFILITILTISFLLNFAYSYEKKRTLKSLVEGSSLIIKGKIIAQTSKIEENDILQSIYTYSTVNIISHYKGETESDRILIKTSGGTYQGISSGSLSSVSLKKGEESLLFLNKNNDHWVVNSISGKLPIITEGRQKKVESLMLLTNDKKHYKKGKTISLDFIISEINKWNQKGG